MKKKIQSVFVPVAGGRELSEAAQQGFLFYHIIRAC